MKFFKTVLAVALIAAMSGCSRSSSSSPAATYSMRATIGSASMNGTVCIATVVSGVLGISGSTVVSGVGGPPQINLAIYSWTGAAGTFALGSTGGNNFGEYIASTGALTNISTSGTVTITSVTTTAISGTFSFTCSGGVSVTAGTFTAQRT